MERNLSIFDQGGDQANQAFRKASFPKTDCFVICFDLGNKFTFQSTYTTWLDELNLESNVTRGKPRILVGMKSDIPADKRCVSKDEALKIIKDYGFLAYVECSA